MMKQVSQKKIAVINDLSGFGRCSLTVALPIISAMKVQCCPLPTAILSNHTEYPNYFFDDYTEKIPAFTENWKKLNLSFDGIATGFLGSERQIQLVIDFIHTFPCNHIIIDPVMGDNGILYDTYTEEMCLQMKELVSCATILTPNLTEACKLTQIPYKKAGYKITDFIEMGKILCSYGPEKIVITGILMDDYICNFIYLASGTYTLQKNKLISPTRPGTGDVFTSIIAASAVLEKDFEGSVKKASKFIGKCLRKSQKLNIPLKDGVCFEEYLRDLSFFL